MNIEYVDNENYEAVLAFLKKENQNTAEWNFVLKDSLFKLCVVNTNQEIQCIFIFEDYPYSLQNKYESITKANWGNWVQNYFEVPCETYHTLWLTKWYTSATTQLTVDIWRFVLSSLFISNFEIEAILLSADTSSEKQFETMFAPLHRIHRNNQNPSNDEQQIDLFCCLSSKILPNIDIRKATVEDFDDLMPLFEENSRYLQQKHGEFFLAELIESSQKDKRLQTLVALHDAKPVGFVCFTTNIDMMSLRNSFYLESFEMTPNETEIDIDQNKEKESDDGPLTIDTSSNECNDDDAASHRIVMINLLCIDSNYIYATKVFAQSIFNYYTQCQYLLSTIVHDEATPNYLAYFGRVHPKPCVECPYNLYLVDKNAMHATLSTRAIDWKMDIEALKQMIDPSVPCRDEYLSNVYDGYVAIVDYKIVAVVYIAAITNAHIAEFRTFYDDLNDTTTTSALLQFMIVNPIFNVNAKGILKDIMRQMQIDTLLYAYDSSDEQCPDPQSVVIENFLQLTPKQFVYSKTQTKKNYALYAFCRVFYAQSQEIINHRIVIIGHPTSDDCAFGLIQQLMTQPDLTFGNMTLISQGVESSNTLLFKSNIMNKLCMNNKIEMVSDSITALDVNRKCIQLKHSGLCMYDILIFANGLSPVPIIPSMAYDNVLLISPHNVQQLEKYIQKKSANRIVFYGESLNMYCILNHLITKCSSKITADKMILVPSSKSCEFYFKNKTLKAIILRQLKDLGVRIVDNVTPVGYCDNKVNGRLVDGMRFIPTDAENVELTLPAQLVILCQNEIDINTFKITNQHPFVIDGQIVIDNEFRTQDTTIYAVGSIAKFSRKFSNNYNESFSVLQYANSFDIGVQCANKVLRHILNAKGRDNGCNLEKEVCIVTQLNGGYTYLYAYNPRFAMRKRGSDDNVQYLQSCHDDAISFVALDSLGYVREILYYGLDWSDEWKQCGRLINIHSSFLSNLQQSFNANEENAFVNICEILSQPQYQIMCDDRFKAWMQTIKKSGSTDKNQMKNDIECLIKRIVNQSIK